jgi:hypothetical protein
MKKFDMAFLLLSLLATGSQAEIINSTTFDDLEAGTVCSRTIWANEGFSTTDWDDGLDKRSLITNEASISGEKSLRIMYPAHQFGPDNTGVQVPLLFTPRNEAYMSYWIRFSDNFSFGTTSYGGKLPGLCGGDRCSGGATCDGTNGFSARFMWRVGGKIKLYLYDMDKTQSYGVDYPLKYPDSTEVTFERGKWYHLMERVKINTDGNTHDGEVEAWVNGQHVLLVTGLRFTSNGDKVDDVDFSTFHGGDDDTWCPTDTCYTLFRQSAHRHHRRGCGIPALHKTRCGSQKKDANRSKFLIINGYQGFLFYPNSPFSAEYSTYHRPIRWSKVPPEKSPPNKIVFSLIISILRSCRNGFHI